MAENLMKVPVKGILKNSTSFEGSSSNKCSSSRGGMKWDEMNILATHHPPDKDYGHMKIEEPKTPYSYHGDDSGDELDPQQNLNSDLLAEKLMEDGNTPACFEHRLSDESDNGEEEETPEEKAKRKVFEHKRKAHYNEFMAVKLARQLMHDDDDLDNEEETNIEADSPSHAIEDMDTKESVTNEEKLSSDMDMTG